MTLTSVNKERVSSFTINNYNKTFGFDGNNVEVWWDESKPESKVLFYYIKIKESKCML
jgi:hypothetical protein